MSCSPVSSSLSGVFLPPVKTQTEIEAIFDKCDLDLTVEFLRLRDDQQNIKPEQNPVKTSRNGLSAHHCDSLILSTAPVNETLDLFIEMLYFHADAVIMVLQRGDFISHPELAHYFKKDGALKSNSYSVLRKNLQWSDNGISESVLEIAPLRAKELPKEIPHYWFSWWLDGQDCDPADLAALARIAHKAQRPVIHCIGGEGRTGTLAAVILAYRAILKGDRSPDVISHAVAQTRKERSIHCVRSSQQYASIYGAVKILLREDGLL